MLKLLLPCLFLLLFVSCTPKTTPSATAVNLPVPDSQMEAEPVLLKEGAVLSLRFVDLQIDKDPMATKKFLKQEYFPAWEGTVPGSTIHYLEGERGAHAGRDVYFQVFPDAATHQRYFNDNGMATTAFKNLQAGVANNIGKDTYGRYFSGWENTLSSDFEIMDTGKPIKKDWMSPGVVMGLHHLVLKPGVDNAAFEKFIENTWAPTRSDALPDSKVIFLKGISGDRAGKYSYIWLINSEETRDYYFPAEAEASRFYTEFSRIWQELEGPENMGRFLRDGGEEEFTDYVVVR